jgi:aerotaxis receptor
MKNLRKDGAYYWVYASIVPNVRHGHVVGYTSVRRKASRRMVAEASAHYAAMR